MENDKLIRRRQLLEMIGMSHTTQWRLERAGRFPARVRIGTGSVGWHLAEVEEWVRARERGQGGALQDRGDVTLEAGLTVDGDFRGKE